MSAELAVIGLDRMAYGTALRLQRELAAKRIAGEIDKDMLVLLEHPPVVTLGRTFQAQNLPTQRNVLATRGVELFSIERGGDVTFHGPGQLVGYPIFDLKQHRKDLHWFLRQIEQSLIHALAGLGIQGQRKEGYTGVWTHDRKIASIGIHVKQWVSWHGFALNVTTDLSYFDLIVPCGITGVEMTSVHREMGERSPRDLWGMTLNLVVLGFADVFGMQPQMTELAGLGANASKRS